MQPVWLCVLLCKCFEVLFENTQWRKVKQMQSVWLCILSGKSSEEAFKDAQWSNVNKLKCYYFLLIFRRIFLIWLFHICTNWPLTWEKKYEINVLFIKIRWIFLQIKVPANPVFGCRLGKTYFDTFLGLEMKWWFFIIGSF